VLVPAAVALDAQEAVFEQPALQIVFELLADEPGQVTAGAFDLLHEAWVMFSNDGKQRGLFRPMPLIGGRGSNRGRRKTARSVPADASDRRAWQQSWTKQAPGMNG
jgi:hypothetical protein